MSNRYSDAGPVGTVLSVFGIIFVVVLIFIPIVGWALIGTFLWFWIMDNKARKKRLQNLQQQRPVIGVPRPIGIGYPRGEKGTSP